MEGGIDKQVIVNTSQASIDEVEQEEPSKDLDYVELVSEIPLSETELDFVNFRLRRCNFLMQFAGLKSLCMRQNLIEEINGLEELVALENLDLYDNRISKIQGLNSLTRLTYNTD